MTTWTAKQPTSTSDEDLYILPDGDAITLGEVRGVRARHAVLPESKHGSPHATMIERSGRQILRIDCESFEAACALRDKIIAAKAADRAGR